MTGAPQSTPARYCLPACILTLLLAFATVLHAQSARRTLAPADLVKDPGGTVLARIAQDVPVVAGRVRGRWEEATLTGWIATVALRDDRRDGFDVAVNLANGTAVRAGPGTGATLAVARAGALFVRLETRTAWTRVRRTGWVPASAIVAPQPRPPAPTPAEKVAPAAARPSVTLPGGTTLASAPRGAAAASLEAPTPAHVVERRDGWSKVRIEGWVPDAVLTGAPGSVQISGADIRKAPDKYIGQTVEWTLQVLSVQQADELRPELPPGQPYVLARGPLPETAFVYLVVRADEAERFRTMEPLAKVKVRATVRSGRTRFLPTPVLNFVRRLD